MKEKPVRLLRNSGDGMGTSRPHSIPGVLGKSGSASNTPRKGEKANGTMANGTPKRIETKIPNGNSISSQGKRTQIQIWKECASF